MVRVGVVIPFYGGTDYLQKLVHSIFSGTEVFDIRVYIVDNSKPLERLEKKYINDQRISVLDAPTGIGYGRACNIGYQKCIEDGCDLLMVLNQDGFLAEGSFKKLIELVLACKEFTAAMPLLTEYHSNRVEPFFTQVYLTPMPDLITDLFAGSTKEYYQIDTLCGACFVLKVKDMKQLSFLFDELYHMYYEDADLYERMRQAGKKVMFVPSAVFHHSHSNTNESIQTVKSLATKRSSHHLFSLKNRKASIGGWALLEFRTVIGHLLKFEFKSLLIETLALSEVLRKLGKIMQRRRNKNFAD